MGVEGKNMPSQSNRTDINKLLYVEYQSICTRFYILQSMKSGLFQMFDFGPEENKKKYNQVSTRHVQLSLVVQHSEKYFFFWGITINILHKCLTIYRK